MTVFTYKPTLVILIMITSVIMIKLAKRKNFVFKKHVEDKNAHVSTSEDPRLTLNTHAKVTPMVCEKHTKNVHISR